MTAPRRRSKAGWLLGAAVLVVLLVGGRWLALETAERAWAQGVAGGDVYLEARNLARLLHAVVLLFSITWVTANLLFVYRVIGSVQMPRRLGDLEIVEAVPHRVLLTITLSLGLLIGLLLTWGTGGWWLHALLAGAPPRFNVADPVLHQDLGVYVGSVPWSAALQNRAIIAVVVVGVVIALLYVGIGSLRWSKRSAGGTAPSGGWTVSAHARAHLGFLLTVFALAIAWGGILDPAETVAGLHGPLDHAAIDYRIPGAPFVAGVGFAAALASLVWGWIGRQNLLGVGWLALTSVAALVYGIVPAAVRRADAAAHGAPALVAETRSLSELAFGIDWNSEGALPAFASPEDAAAAVPLWDAERVAQRVRLPRGGVTLDPAPRGQVAWLFAPAPDEDALVTLRPRPSWTEVHRGAWAATGPARMVLEVDSGLVVDGTASDDSALWFGPGFEQFAVAPLDGGPRGVAIEGWWRRTALAWALQSPELARDDMNGLSLVWRRDVKDRLERIAPFATFQAPFPAVADGRLWWVAYGYVASTAFPLAPATPWEGRRVRYLHAGLVGAVSGSTGETRLFFAPGSDSLTAAWARIFEPLVAPADSLPPALRRALPYPKETFALAAAMLVRDHGDTSAWNTRPRDPFAVPVPSDGAVWTGQAFERVRPARFTAFLAGRMAPEGPRLVLWRPQEGDSLPPLLLGSPETAAGTLRIWPARESLFSLQVLFAQRPEQREPPRLEKVFVSWGSRGGEGKTLAAALRDLQAPRLASGADGTPAERLDAARRLLAQADSALAAGDFETFGRVYRQLKRLLGAGRRELAPTIRPH